ncbi:hypothetical protein HPB51_025647 [Rhipicephalus microplus]|uniref:Uncharacterized protein n=1 Tax=Rhipicephalus microplus TaxID=6941 RepID=A0A9J6F9A0_RHIMP|nr:hypothetical protein HPB51_025647 [Rhipicephalus microplus]
MLRFWMTVKRCEKTLQHLPVLTTTTIPLVVPRGHIASKLGPHTLYVKLCKHQNHYVVVDLKESPGDPLEIVQTYYLMTVQPQALPDEDMTALGGGAAAAAGGVTGGAATPSGASTPLSQSGCGTASSVPSSTVPTSATVGRSSEEATAMETELPKAFLRVANFLQLDTFAIVHGPCTKIDMSLLSAGGKRKLVGASNETLAKQPRYAGYFISELAHVVAFCDDRIPFCTLTVELNKRNICHQGMQIEANGTNFLVKIVQMPTGEDWEKETAAALQAATLSCTLRLQVKGIKAWQAEFVFCSCPLPSQSPKERGPRRPVCFMYDFAAGTTTQVASMVEEMLQDWNTIGHLYGVVLRFAEALRLGNLLLLSDQHNSLMSVVDIKSFTYKKLVLGYGMNKASTVTIYWRHSEKRFHLAFGVVGHTASASNPHTVVAPQLQHEFNQHRSIATLVEVLRDTYAPLLSLTKLPSAPQLGVINSRPQVPVQTFVIIPQSSTHLRLVYRNTYVLDIQCRPEGFVAVRDGAYSKFDKTKAVEDFTPIQGLRAFLSKFVDESACQLRRRSQSEDDNPPSPIPTLEGLGMPGGAARVLPQRSWAAAIPTLLSHKALDLACQSGAGHGGPMGAGALIGGGALAPHCSPLERFLGCVFMRKSLHRVVQGDDNMTMLGPAEPGVIQFRAETLQCRVSLNPATLQSLHLKLSQAGPTDQWAAEELQLLERYFDTKTITGQLLTSLWSQRTSSKFCDDTAVLFAV